FGTEVGVTVEKSINTVDQGQVWSVFDVDADSPNVAVVVPEGAEVYWTYTVTSQSTLPLTIVSLLDNGGTLGSGSDDFAPLFVSGDSNNNGLLDPDEAWVYSSQGVVNYNAQAGLYENVVTVVADDGSSEVRDDDLNYHFGSDPDVQVEKALNAIDPFNPTSIADGDFEPGPEILAGTELVWTYQVINAGNIAIVIDLATFVDDFGTPADASDDFTPTAVLAGDGIHNLGDLDADGIFDPGETWLFTSVGVISYQAQLGQYVNEVVIFAEEPNTEEVVFDNDKNHHFGSDQAEGLTPGFWKQNADQFGGTQWPRGIDGELIYSLTTRVGQVFDVPVDAGGEPIYPVAFATLTEALDFNGGGAFALIRHAVAALLNATHLQVAYPLTPPDIVNRTNAALASGDSQLIEDLKYEFDAFNNLGGGLDQQVAKVGTSNASAAEEDTSVFVTLDLSDTETVPVSISYYTTDGTAVAGEDYVASSGTVVFAPGEKTKQVEITLIGDLIHEGSETVSLVLTAPIGVQIGRNPAQITLSDNDAIPVLAIEATDSSATEVGPTPATFVVSRTANVNGAVSVTVDFGGTADSSDYAVSVVTGGTWNALNGLLTLADGVATATLTITPVDDNEGESDESVTLSLSNPVNANLGVSTTATAVIIDDDTVALPQLVVNDLTVTEGDRGGIFIDVTVTLSGPAESTVTVDIATADVTATADSDYKAASGTLIIPAGETATTFRIRILNDRLDEGSSETFEVRLFNAVGADIADATGIVTIVDNDAALLAAAAAVGSTEVENSLTETDLARIVEVAKHRWSVLLAANPEFFDMLSSASFGIADLPGLTLGVTSSGMDVLIDINAAGHGWFVDETPYSDSEFGSSRQSPVNIDLLSVVMHEIGHVLGLEHEGFDMMAPALSQGVRVTPDASPVAPEKGAVVGMATLKPVPAALMPMFEKRPLEIELISASGGDPGIWNRFTGQSGGSPTVSSQPMRRPGLASILSDTISALSQKRLNSIETLQAGQVRISISGVVVHAPAYVSALQSLMDARGSEVVDGITEPEHEPGDEQNPIPAVGAAVLGLLGWRATVAPREPGFEKQGQWFDKRI
ncbi:MAG: matrixin family metalloprotease, partial [Gammaproteobacteria bacterium]|nr:matrixin family metalloprotease [Gammaproteobacteria bacterium]